MLKNRKVLATVAGLFLITSVMVLGIYKSPNALGQWSFIFYMGMVILLILGFMTLNVAQKKFWKGFVDMKSGKNEE